MSKRLDDLRTVDPVLSTIAQGYKNAAFVYNKLFPVVKVRKMKGKVPYFGKDAFTVRETRRSIRSDSNRIQPSDFNLIEYETLEQDIESALDYLEEEESADFYRYEQRLTKDLSDILELGKEKAAADLAQDDTQYPSGSKTEITFSEAFNDYTLDTDPVSIIKDAMSSVRSKIAKYPNTMIIGDASYRALVNHPKIIERIKYAGISQLTQKHLSELLEIPDINIGLAVYSNDGETFSDVWQDNIILAYCDKSNNAAKSEFNPSFGYTFQKQNKPEIDTYLENGGKIKVIRNTDNYDVKITSCEAAHLIYNTNH